jgi:glycosyltransferase involved in cell wall biosynthesis
MTVVPNGVDVDRVRFVTAGERAAVKERFGLAGRTVALFVGSWHGPNVDALLHIVELAGSLGDVLFLVVGSCSLAIQGLDVPSNVLLLGPLDEPCKDLVVASTDVALNPVVSGSGTNLKMLEYFAAGVPVVSTSVGVRGLAARDGEHLLTAGREDFASVLGGLIEEDAAAKQARTLRARRLVEERFDWRAIARRYMTTPAFGRLSPRAHQASLMAA